MFRLNRVTINGFKDPNRVVNLEFAEGPITVIHGENGSGKTTLLKVLHSALSLKAKPFEEENVSSIQIELEESDQGIIEFEISKKDGKYNISYAHEKVSFIKGNKYTKSVKKELSHEEFREKLKTLNLILFGINRSTIDPNIILFERINKDLSLIQNSVSNKSIQKKNIHISAQSIIRELIKMTDIKDDLPTEFIGTERSLVIDNLRVGTIEKSLVNAYNKGQQSVLTEMSNAFFTTIDNAINITGDVELPKKFAQRFKQQKFFFLSFVENLDESATKSKLKEFIELEDYQINKEGPVFKSLLKNLLLKAEQDEVENLDLKAIYTIVSFFNQFVIHKKKLIITSTEAFVQLDGGTRHELKDLSSGERHLLSFLTLFLILGRGRSIFLIDEPEISMSIKWQRQLLPLLQEFSPHAQIIVATHSPEIADGHTEYLKELV